MPLRVGRQLIQRLSGPTMGQVLYPTKRGLPTFFLFGDRHNSMRSLCKTCECKGPDDPHCCVEIFSNTFLTHLDELAKTQPVSFYTEFFEPKKEKDLFDRHPKQFAEHLQSRLASPPKGVMQLLREHLIACYLRDESRADSVSTKFCPTQYIHWNYGDLRQRGTSLSLSELLTKEPYFYEPLVFRVLYNLYDYVEDVNKKTMSDWMECLDVMLITKHLGPPRSKAFWYSLYLLLSNPKAYTEWFIRDHPLSKHSTLRSMVDSPKKGLDRLFLSKALEEELMYYSHRLADMDQACMAWANVFFQLSRDELSSIPHKSPKDSIILIDVTLPFLDLYFILHSVHTNEKGVSIGYFGSTHVEGILHLLVDHLRWYRIENRTIKGKAGESRCLELSSVDWKITNAKDSINE